LLKLENNKKNLVISPVGDKSYHKSWLNGRQRHFDIMLIYFGMEDNRYIEDADYYLCIRDLFKYETIKAAIDKYPDVIRSYESIWLPDDDIITVSKSINKLFAIFHYYKLSLAQPALKGKVSHKITREDLGCALRYTNFVELCCPLFKTELLFEILPMLTLNRSGWGIDYLWSKHCKDNNKQMAIVDRPVVYHVPSSKKGDRTEHYQKLAGLGIDPRHDLKLVIEKFNLAERYLQHEVYDSVKVSIILKIIRILKNRLFAILRVGKHILI
jgi:hypothetical protein